MNVVGYRGIFIAHDLSLPESWGGCQSVESFVVSQSIMVRIILAIGRAGVSVQMMSGPSQFQVEAPGLPILSIG